MVAKKGDGGSSDEGATGERGVEAPSNESGSASVFKKRRLIGGDGYGVTFRAPGEDGDEEDVDEGTMSNDQEAPRPERSAPQSIDAPPIEPGIITIVDED